MKHQRISVVAAVAVTFLICRNILAQGDTPVQQKKSPEVQFIAAGIENARQQLECAQATVTRYEYIPQSYSELLKLYSKAPAKLPVGSQETTRTGQWYYQKGKLALSVEADPKVPSKSRSTSFVVADGRASMLDKYDENLGKPTPVKKPHDIYYFGQIAPAASTLKDGIWGSGMEYFDPRAYAHFQFPGGPALNQLLLDPKMSATVVGEETLYGSPCRKVQIWVGKNYEILFWIDVEHGFLLRQMEERAHMDGKILLDTQVTVPRVIESNGIWMPAIVEHRNFFPPPDKPEDALKVPQKDVLLKRTTITNFKTDCSIPAKTFVMEWPEGTNVNNQITQERFTVGPKTENKSTKTNAKAGQ
jgi:hypothetical protein